MGPPAAGAKCFKKPEAEQQTVVVNGNTRGVSRAHFPVQIHGLGVFAHVFINGVGPRVPTPPKVRAPFAWPLQTHVPVPSPPRCPPPPAHAPRPRAPAS